MSKCRIASILLRERKCDSSWLMIQANDLAVQAKETQNSSILVFGCLEARNAIEQLWFEILMLIHSGSMSRELFDQCRRRRDGFLAAIGEAEPRYRQLSRFTALCMQLDSKSPCEGIAWDLGRLKKLWHAHSGYCHAQAHPTATLSDPKWFSDGLSLIEESYDYFREKMSAGASALLKPESMTPEASIVWEDFVAERITEEQTLIRLQIVQRLRTTRIPGQS